MRRGLQIGSPSIFLSIPTFNREESFVQESSWWTDHEGSYLLFVSTPMNFAYHSSLTFLKERCSLFFSIAVAKHCVHAHLSFFCLLWLGSCRSYAELEGTMTLAVSGILLLWAWGIHGFVIDIWLLTDLQGLQLDHKDAYLAYHQSQGVDLDAKIASGGSRLFTERAKCLMFQLGW